VEYNKGVDNRVADALSKKEVLDEELTLSFLYIPTFSWIAELK
jgi:hypothetical protein